MRAFLHKARLLLSFRPKTRDRWRQRAVTEAGPHLHVEKHPRLFGPDEWVLQGGRTVSSAQIVRFWDRSEYDT